MERVLFRCKSTFFNAKERALCRCKKQINDGNCGAKTVKYFKRVFYLSEAAWQIKEPI
jgi:hypothetical protein